MPRICLLPMLLVLCVLPVAAQQDQTPPPTISGQPLTAEQLSVYHALLAGWFQDAKFDANLSAVTDSSSDSIGEDAACLAPFHLEKPSAFVHRIRPEDLAALGSSHIHLIDPEFGANDVKANDPGTAIRHGKSVDDAVNNGFRHALFTLSEIRFNADRTVAVVSYSFWCGSLCGNGSTLVFAKQKDGSWKRAKECGGYIS